MSAKGMDILLVFSHGKEAEAREYARTLKSFMGQVNFMMSSKIDWSSIRLAIMSLTMKQGYQAKVTARY